MMALGGGGGVGGADRETEERLGLLSTFLQTPYLTSKIQAILFDIDL